MRPSPPARNGLLTRRTLLAWAVVALAFGLAWKFDPQIYRALKVREDEQDWLVSRAWYQALRSVGYLPLWVSLGLALIAQGWTQRRILPGFLVGFMPALCGGVCEALQHAFRRVKPGWSDGVHKYHFIADGKDPSFGFPSSHAAVAFGGAFMLAFLYPRAGAVALALASGCALTRLLQGGHFLTDVLASAVVGYALAYLFRPRNLRR